MKFYRFPALVVNLLVVALPSHDAMAWGDEGHQIVAMIAYAHITPAVNKRSTPSRLPIRICCQPRTS